MSTRVKLPRTFQQIINSTYSLRRHQILEAYLDKKEYQNEVYNNTPDLREYLGLDDNDSVCDCFCIISVEGEGEKGIVFEDKKSKHSKDIHIAKDQLSITSRHLIEKRNKNIDYAIVCNIKLDPAFETRTVKGLPVKALFSAINRSKQIHLENMKNLKGEKIPLLYHKD